MNRSLAGTRHEAVAGEQRRGRKRAEATCRPESFPGAGVQEHGRPSEDREPLTVRGCRKLARRAGVALPQQLSRLRVQRIDTTFSVTQKDSSIRR